MLFRSLVNDSRFLLEDSTFLVNDWGFLLEDSTFLVNDSRFLLDDSPTEDPRNGRNPYGVVTYLIGTGGMSPPGPFGAEARGRASEAVGGASGPR